MEKYAVVTGASKGIGKAISLKLLQEGFKVIATARSINSFEAILKEVPQDIKDNFLPFVADASKEADIENLVAFINRTFSNSVEILVHNAGVFLPGSILTEEENTYNYLMDTNVKSAYLLSRALVPKMKANKRGHIFTICSIASIMAYEAGGTYTISKFALLGFTKALRAELKNSNVAVTALLPGAVLTNSWAGTTFPEERFMKPEHIADALWNAYSIAPQTVIEEMILRPMEGDI